MNFVQRAWYGAPGLLRALLPLSWLFSRLAQQRRRRLQGRFQGQAYAAPVVVVGNISVGGTGKTPLLQALAASLGAAGVRVGIVSRGYGGQASSKQPRAVPVSGAAADYGDEAVLLARESRCPVVICQDRDRAVSYLLAREEVDLVLSDDGLQHYRMHRDFEIAVVDAQRGLGNGYCLPVGPLRETPARLTEVDCVVVNGGDVQVLARNVVLPDRCVEMTIVPVALRQLSTGRRLAPRDWDGDKKVHAVAGIGNPERFAATLADLGLEPELHQKPDHHRFVAEDLCFDDARPVVITAKDAVKCASLADQRVWVLEVEARVDSTLRDALIALVAGAKQRRAQA